jgi:hypothetical protein
MIRNLIVSIGLVGFGLVSLSGQQPQFNATQYRAGFNGETLTVTNASKALTSSVYAVSGSPNPDYAYVTVETDSIRWWPCTGALCTVGAPTSTTGHLVPAGSSLTIWGYANIQNFRMIRVTTDATVQISYYKFSGNQF